MLLVLAVTAGSAPLAWSYKCGNYSWAVAVSSDGRHVIAGSDDMHAYFFSADSAEGKPLWSYTTSGYVRHVAISSSGTYAAASDTDGNIFFFRPGVSGDPIWSYRADSPIDALAMTQDGDYSVAGDRKGTVYLFSAEGTGQPLWQHVIPGGILALSFSQSRDLAVTSTRGGLYFFGQVPSRSEYAWIFQDYTSFPQLVMSDDASYIITGGSDGYVYLLNRSGQLADRQRLGGAVSALSLSRTRGLVVAGGTNGNASLYAIQDGFVAISSLATYAPVTSAYISENGERIAVATLDGVISMFSQSLTTHLWTFNTGAIVHSLSMSSDGLVMGAAGDTGNIYLFEEEAHAKKNGVALGVALVSVAVAAFSVAYFIWRRRTMLWKTKTAAGKTYHYRHHETFYRNEQP
jgi:WD40 repeat protein